MKYSNLPLLQVCMVFFLGVWFGFTEFGHDFSTYLLTSLTLFVFFLISFSVARRYSKLQFVFTFSAVLFLFSLGVLNTKTHLPKHQKNHYTHLLKRDSIQNNYVAFEGEIRKPLKPNAYNDKYEVHLNSLNGIKTKGKILFQISKPNKLQLSSNSKISGYGQFKTFEDPKNPQQFNFKDYMFTQQMSHVINSEANQIINITDSAFGFAHLGEQARTHIQHSLQNYEFTKDQMDIMQALLLGQKQDIDPDTYNTFSKAGVVHILAVSGLHVGIILLILQFISKPLLRITYGRILRTGVVLLGIWSFAMLAGFTPSVLRAAVMFSFLSLALNFKRKTSAINTLALSAVLLILINPYLIYHVGFQLSYLAVISIVTLQPRLSKLYQPKFIVDQKVWDIVTVTLTAQLGVMPLSLYYFHQFPGLFLISNLLILPGLGLILGGGVLVILMSLLGILPKFLATMYGNLLDFLLSVVNRLASQEELVFSDIYFSKTLLISSLVLFLSLVHWDFKQKTRSYFILNFSLLALMIFIHLEHRKQGQQQEVVIFQSYGNSQLGVLEGHSLKLYSDKIQPKDSIPDAYHIKNYKVLRGIDTVHVEPFRNIYQLYSTKTLLVLDSIPVYPKQDFYSAYLLLKNSPDLNLDRVIAEIKPKQIIADGSNYKSDIQRWEASSQRSNIKFHSTWEDGAFILRED